VNLFTSVIISLFLLLVTIAQAGCRRKFLRTILPAAQGVSCRPQNTAPTLRHAVLLPGMLYEIKEAGEGTEEKSCGRGTDESFVCF